MLKAIQRFLVTLVLVMALAALAYQGFLFWQAQDVLDAEGVTFAAHSFPDDRIEMLLEADDVRPSLWYMPNAAIPTAEGVRIYYQRVEPA